MQRPHLPDAPFYHEKHLSIGQPRSHVISQRQFHNQFRKPLNHNYNDENWCETCDRSFPSLDLLNKHKQQHQKCNIDGCQFIAHPKVITKHIQMQHSSGLYSKIAKLNNPEGIQKWREERKRKYPTKLNMEKKAAEIKEKIERGEKIGLGQIIGHKKSDRIVMGANKKNVMTYGRHHQRSRRQNPHPSISLTQKSRLPKKVHHVLLTADNLRILKPFTGIQDILMSDTLEETVEELTCDFIIEDDDMMKLPEPDKDTQELLNNNKPNVCGALSTLMCNYRSSEEETETDETKDQILTDPVKTDKNDTVNKTEVSIALRDMSIASLTEPRNPITENYNKSDEDSGPEETKIDKIKESSILKEQPNLVRSSKGKQIPVKNNYIQRNFSKPKHQIPSTLLQKLLRREVQQERNIILQCIRHIVNNTFFDNPSV